MIKSVIILGGHIQALGLARQIKAKNKRVIIITRDNFSVARFSKSLNRFIICKSNTELMNFLNENKSKSTLLFPTDDGYIDFITNNYKYLDNHFTIGIANPEITNYFSNKRQTYQFAERNNIPHPKSWYPESLDDIINISDKVDYPVVLKPAIMYTFHEEFGKKAFLCNTKEDLIALSKRIAKTFPIKNILIQEFLSGGAPTLFSYGTFAINGNPICAMIANRIRQNPMDFGNSTTFAISIKNEEIEHSAKKILQLSNYFGLGEIEFMFDQKSGQYKFLEINTRAWKWHTLSNGLGFNYISYLIDYFDKTLMDEPYKFYYNRDMAWIERFTDFVVISKEVLHKRMNLLKVIKQTMHYKKVSAVWSIKDPIPAIMYILMIPILYIKRY